MRVSTIRSVVGGSACMAEMQVSTGSQVSLRHQRMLSSGAASQPFCGVVSFRSVRGRDSSVLQLVSRPLLAAPSAEPQPVFHTKALHGGIRSSSFKSGRMCSPRAVAGGVTSRPDTSKDTLDELALLPGASSPATPLSYNDIIQLIDVQRPYYALFDMAQLSKAAVPTVRGYFLKESESHEENKDPISGSELGRHSAIMGSVACALANPVKDKHYYLAFGAKSVRIEGEGDERVFETEQEEQAELLHALNHSRSGGLFKGVAECTKFRRGMAKAIITIFRWEASGAYEVYGRFEITYAVFTQEAFLKTVPPLPHGYASPSTFPVTDNGSMTSCNPYVDPVSIVEAPELHTGDTRTGVLSFLDASKAAGHFPLLPALPVSVLGSNAMKCVSFFEGVDNYRILKCKLKFSKLVWLGQTVRFCASEIGEKSYRITFNVEEEQVGSMEVDLDF